MNAQEYASLARRTLKELPFRQHMIHMGLGVTGEFGELIDATKKALVYGRPYDHTNAIEEVGDVLWYIANLLPEMQVDPVYMQRSLDRGWQAGLQLQQRMPVWKDFNIGAALLDWNKAVATVASDLSKLDEQNLPGTGAAVQYIEQLAGNVGVVCGMLGIDHEQAMAINIAKLVKRYGDKYSDFAAINRDTGAEREVLEGGEGAGLAAHLRLVEGAGQQVVMTNDERLDDGSVQHVPV